MTWQVFALGSAFFAGLTAIFGKLGVEGLDSDLATLIRVIILLPMIAAIVAFRGEWHMPQGLEWRSVTFLALSAIATGMSWLLYYRALQMAPASMVAPIDRTSVVFAMVLGVAVLGEPLTARLMAGGILMVAGLLILAWP